MTNEATTDEMVEDGPASFEEPAVSAAYINPALEHLSVPCALITAPGDLLYMNPAFQDVIGQHRAVAFGHRFSEFVHPDDQEKLRVLLREVAASPREQMTANLSLTRGELNKWADWHLTVVNALDDARTAGIVISMEPVDEDHVRPIRRIAVEETAEQIIPVGMNWLASGNMEEGLQSLYVDDTVRKKFRLSTNKIIDPITFVQDAFYHEDLSKILMRLPRLTPQRNRFRTTVRLHQPDGHLGVYEAFVNCQYDAAGKLISACGTLHDISKDVQRSTELSDLKHVLDVMEGQVDEVVLRLTPEFKISYVTSTIQSILGVERGLVLGRRVSDFKGIQEVERIVEALEQVVSNQEPLHIVLSVDNPTKGAVRVQAKLYPVPSRSNHNHIEVLTILREVSEEEDATPALEAENEVGGDLTKHHFLNNMGHDLKTPLASVIELADLIINQADEAEDAPAYVDYARTIQFTTRSLMDVVDDILAVTRWEAGQYELNFQHFAPESLVTKALSGHLDDIEQRNIQIKKLIATDLPTLECDSGSVVRVLHAMISNAIRFSPDQTELSIGVRVHEDMMQFAFIDQGYGMKDEVLAQVRKLADQPDPGLARQLDRVGMGYTFTCGIVQAHNGHLEVKSTEGEGTRVIISLPLMQTS